MSKSKYLIFSLRLTLLRIISEGNLFMRKVKFNNVIATVLILSFSVLALVWFIPRLPSKNTTELPSYQGVIELYNVETFEGGCGSRSSWLTNCASKFESSHKGLFVHVTNLTVEELADKLEQGSNFDIICFGRGVGNGIQDKLCTLTSANNLNQSMLLAGQISGKQYALPLYSGCYMLFARQSMLSNDELLSNALSKTVTKKIGKNTVMLSPLICGFTHYNSPLSALSMSGGRGNVTPNVNVTQYNAYELFVANKTAVTLLGTQRDLYRLSARQSNGKIENLSCCVLGGYTDLVQYVGVNSNCGTKLDSCIDFVEYLTSSAVQSTLVNLSLFSVDGKSYYTDNVYSQCEKALQSSYVPNVFGDEQSILNQRSTAITTLGM